MIVDFYTPSYLFFLWYESTITSFVFYKKFILLVNSFICFSHPTKPYPDTFCEKESRAGLFSKHQLVYFANNLYSYNEPRQIIQIINTEK